jgi:prophage antirepressor-like protein
MRHGYFIADHITVVRWHIDKTGTTWWNAEDVCRVLGLGELAGALSGLDSSEKLTISNAEGQFCPLTRGKAFSFVSISGLISLCQQSPEWRPIRLEVNYD